MERSADAGVGGTRGFVIDDAVPVALRHRGGERTGDPVQEVDA
jgi:hypothetical protein